MPRRVQQLSNPAYQRQAVATGGPATAPVRRVATPASTGPEQIASGGTPDFDASPTGGAGKFDWRRLLARIREIRSRPSRDELYLHWLQDRASRPVGNAYPLAVLNLKGGVGKTTVVEALGSTLAEVRNDGVIAIDLDTGDLAERHGRRHQINMGGTLADGSVPQYLDERAHAYRNGSGLDVLGLPKYSPSEWRREHDDFITGLSKLGKSYSVLLIDCLKSVNSGVMRAVLVESRALVIVSSASVDALRKTRTTLNMLRDNGYQRLLESTVLVVNRTDRARLKAAASTELAQLSGRVGAVLMLPFDRHVREGAEIVLQRLSRKSRRRYLELAAVLIDLATSSALDRDAVAEIGAYPRSG
ncbi:MinD/ParA family ATP-binding protein [Mycobacterium szulgai]|uniref:MinD/ParA family ATP-binding protein n=1 Tax=Mycobacterium szulgai TaxID=1787 RepID=UPI001FEAE81F|nr:MinD/ParA family protein [Mycobacterium szulgai]